MDETQTLKGSSEWLPSHLHIFNFFFSHPYPFFLSVEGFVMRWRRCFLGPPARPPLKASLRHARAKERERKRRRSSLGWDKWGKVNLPPCCLSGRVFCPLIRPTSTFCLRKEHQYGQRLPNPRLNVAPSHGKGERKVCSAVLTPPPSPANVIPVFPSQGFGVQVWVGAGPRSEVCGWIWFLFCKDKVKPGPRVVALRCSRARGNSLQEREKCVC